MSLEEFFGQILFNIGTQDITVGVIIRLIIILGVTYFLYRIIAKRWLPNYLEDETRNEGGSIFRSVLYIGSLFLVLQSFNLDYPLFSNEKYKLRISDIFEAVLIILLARLIIWSLTRVILRSYYNRNKIDTGAQFAVNQLLQYVIYIVAILLAMSSLGLQMTVLWGGAAALLVGLGLGLQQTFNDFFSGLILLFERSVSVGDVVNIEGLIGTVKKIGLRASIVEGRDSISVIVPNSKLVTDNVINWSHYDAKARFTINVGVAYGSDTELVKKILLKVAEGNIYVKKHPTPFVRFTNFGDSSLDFELLFYSRNFIVIEDIKSDLRFEIDKAFRENDISIPFPQRDVWMRK